MIVVQPNLSRVHMQQLNLSGFTVSCTNNKVNSWNNTQQVVTHTDIMLNRLSYQMAKGYWIVGAGLLHFSSVVNYLLSRLCQSEVQLCFNKRVQLRRDLRWLFKDTTTILDHKHQFYGFVNQLNSSPMLSTFNLKLSNQIKHATSVFN